MMAPQGAKQTAGLGIARSRKHQGGGNDWEEETAFHEQDPYKRRNKVETFFDAVQLLIRIVGFSQPA